MINELIIRKLVDHILLNACSVSSSGLYNGKAGLALALFETARYLQDEYIEEQALNLLQEALLSKTDDIGFENGLSGIGYVLLYLIENDFIDADFEEIFGYKYEIIISEFDKQKENPGFLLNSIRMNYFFKYVKNYYSTDKRIGVIVKSIFEANELYLAIQFFDFKDIHYIRNKNTVLENFENYLKIVYDCSYSEYSHVILKDYSMLYRSGWISSSYKVAYYLEKLDIKKLYIDIITNNKQFSSLKNNKNMSLKSCIELSNLSENINIINSITNMANDDFEDSILRRIIKNTFVAGYEQGISKLLIVLTNNKTNLL